MSTPAPFPRKHRSPLPQVGYFSNELDRLARHDLKDLAPSQEVLNLLIDVTYSDALFTTHQSCYGDFGFANFFRPLPKQPVENASTFSYEKRQPKKDEKITKKVTTATSPTKQTFESATATLINAKIILKRSSIDETSFARLFPNTDLPTIMMINGRAKAPTPFFNSLLVSKLRAAKTKLGIKPSAKLDNKLVLHISRQITEAIKLAILARRQRSQMKKSTGKTPSKKAAPPSKEVIEFVSPHVTKEKKKRSSKKEKTPTPIEKDDATSTGSIRGAHPQTEEATAPPSSHPLCRVCNLAISTHQGEECEEEEKATKFEKFIEDINNAILPLNQMNDVIEAIAHLDHASSWNRVTSDPYLHLLTLRSSDPEVMYKSAGLILSHHFSVKQFIARNDLEVYGRDHDSENEFGIFPCPSWTNHKFSYTQNDTEWKHRPDEEIAEMLNERITTVQSFYGEDFFPSLLTFSDMMRLASD